MKKGVKSGEARVLLIDADDTLWENSVYYERVIQAAINLLERIGVNVQSFQAALDAAERRRIPLQGYGTVNFTHSLVKTFQAFLPPGSEPGLAEQIEKLSLGILEHPVEVLETVPETLDYLARRHSLFLITKGDPVEQLRKIRDSKLRDFFQDVEILPEKDASAYSSLVGRRGWEPSTTWMIGNSPRSDINPALVAGLHAIYIPHIHTWTFEHEQPIDHPRLTRIERFLDLMNHF
jgi:putative hydrolase of the HAD superfamily